MNPKINFFFEEATRWREEFARLRVLVLDCQLTEELKWGKPCYTLDGANVVLIHGFKDYCALLFFKGALIKDTKGILVQQTQNVQAARQIRFKNAGEIGQLAPTLKAYIQEATNIEKSGTKVAMKPTTEFAMPDEFAKALAKSAALKNAFTALTPGRQRGYLLHFASAKQAATREARVAKCKAQILAGKGLED